MQLKKNSITDSSITIIHFGHPIRTDPLFCPRSLLERPPSIKSSISSSRPKIEVFVWVWAEVLAKAFKSSPVVYLHIILSYYRYTLCTRSLVNKDSSLRLTFVSTRIYLFICSRVCMYYFFRCVRCVLLRFFIFIFCVLISRVDLCVLGASVFGARLYLDALCSSFRVL